MSEKPFSAACERNREPILALLRHAFGQRRRVLEIGSGTGQHAVHFAAAMPWLQWQCSDRAENLPGIRAWLDEAALPNLPQPWQLDVSTGPWPAEKFDAVFSANTLHIMSWPEVEQLFAGIARVLATAGVVAIYGPFTIGGRFTSASNEAFDRSLKQAAPHRGIRDRDAVAALAGQHGLRLRADHAMPANNRTLVFEGVSGGA